MRKRVPEWTLIPLGVVTIIGSGIWWAADTSGRVEVLERERIEKKVEIRSICDKLDEIKLDVVIIKNDVKQLKRRRK